jgi:hypothetical protein
LRCILGTSRNFYPRLAMITMHIQTVTAAKKESDDTENLYVKQETGRGHPVMGEISLLVFEDVLVYMFLMLHKNVLRCKNKG